MMVDIVKQSDGTQRDGETEQKRIGWKFHDFKNIFIIKMKGEVHKMRIITFLTLIELNMHKRQVLCRLYKHISDKQAIDVKYTC